MIHKLSVRTLAVALAAVLATACASTGDEVVKTEEQAIVPEGPLGMMVQDLVYGSPEEQVAAAGEIAEQGVQARAAAPFLIEALAGGEPALRAEAARALSLIGAEPAPAVSALVKALGADTDDDVLEAVTESLGRIGAPAVKPLQKSLEMGTPTARRLSAKALGIMGHEAALAEQDLLWALRDPDLGVRAAAARAIGRVAHGSTEAVQPLVRALDDDQPEVRAAAAWSLGEFGETARWTTLSLVNKLKDESAEVRREAARALGRMGPCAAQATLDLQSTTEFDPDEGVRRESAEALRRIRGLTEGEVPVQK
jgi:HEAT repeat protein